MSDSRGFHTRQISFHSLAPGVLILPTGLGTCNPHVSSQWWLVKPPLHFQLSLSPLHSSALPQ